MNIQMSKFVYSWEKAYEIFEKKRLKCLPFEKPLTTLHVVIHIKLVFIKSHKYYCYKVYLEKYSFRSTEWVLSCCYYIKLTIDWKSCCNWLFSPIRFEDPIFENKIVEKNFKDISSYYAGYGTVNGIKSLHFVFLIRIGYIEKDEEKYIYVLLLWTCGKNETIAAKCRVVRNKINNLTAQKRWWPYKN